MVSLNALSQWNAYTNSRQAPKRASDEGAKKRRGRPPGKRTSQAVNSRVAKPAVTKTNKTGKTTKTTKISQKSKATKPTSRKRPQLEDAEDELSGATHNLSQSQKRKTNIESDELVEEQPNARKKYVQLETKTRRIPQEQIDTWPHVSAEVLEQIVAVIRDAKKDIANTQRDERKVIAAHNALNPLVRRLARQLSGSRIPPQAKDVHFNVDKLTERNAHVFKEVTTARHSKQLLSEQTKVIQSLLRKDEENLEQLKRDARKWRAEWKHQAKHGRVSYIHLELCWRIG
jgi:hypothetical protein